MSWAGRKPRSLRPICDINVAAFVGIMMALFVMFASPQLWDLLEPNRGGSTDWPHARHPRDLREANRTDAICIAVQRTGDVWLGNTRVRPYELAAGIRERLREGSEQKGYISADARAQYGRVREVLEAVQSAGVERVAFLVGERSPP
jgi:biopolymer transport protein ExbD